MPTNTCRHIKEDGVFCNNPALHRRNYCYAYLLARGRQMRMAREALRQRLRPLFLPPLDDLNAVRNAISLLMAAHAAERIGERSLGLMLWGLQQAASILKFQACMPAAAGAGDQAQERVEAYPGFEREFGLPEDFDLSQPPEVAFPPLEGAEPASATAALEAAVPGQDAVRLASACCPEPGLVTPEDMELEEIQATKDYATWKQRFDEVQARRARERRKVDEARWLIQATQRNYDVIHRPPKVREDWEKILAEEQARERAHSEPSRIRSEAGRKPPQTVAEEAPLPKAVGQGRQKRTKRSRAVVRAE